MFDIRRIRNTHKCPMIGNLQVEVIGATIELVALDEQGHVKPNSYGMFQAASETDALRRVELAWTMFHSFKCEDRPLAAQEAFRALIGGYSVR